MLPEERAGKHLCAVYVVLAMLLCACIAGALCATPDSGGPVCPFPPEGPGVCLYCPCPWDYYILPCPEDETCGPLGFRNQMVDMQDFLFLLGRWGEPVMDAGGCIPPPGYETLEIQAMLDLIANWGCECSDGL